MRRAGEDATPESDPRSRPRREDAAAHRLGLRWADPDGAPAARFVRSVASLFFASADRVSLRTPDGLEEDDLDLAECLESLLLEPTSRLTFSTPGGTWTIQAGTNDQASDDPAPTRAAVEIPAVWQPNALFPPTLDLQWLQVDQAGSSPLPVLAVPFENGIPHPSALSALVALASRCGTLAEATAHPSAADPSPLLARWHLSKAAPGASKPTSGPALYPVRSHASEAVWFPESVPSSPLSPVPAADAVLWLELPAPIPANPLFSPETRARLAGPTRNPAELPAVATPILGRLLGDLQLEVCPLSELASTAFLAPAPAGSILVLAPEPDRVRIGLDLSQPPDLLLDALLHAAGHLVLGHVRPGDTHGHADTADSVCGLGTLRRWDREVREAFPGWFLSEIRRKVEKLADCTPLEKARLGLWRMMGEMLGQSRTLHARAGEYQQAAYQRQAAQRLLAQLEEYGGAMLCDGVGLGKTYVATTLLVHYANTWRDQRKVDPDSLLTDPFRVTILAPNSVVSTWRREAIPPLAAFGVPLATIRVVSHTKLSRISKASAVLERPGHGALSDLEHLLLSDLVVVDEAHNFRSVAARRTVVLRDLLRLQPRREVRRKVVLLTATPVNNSLDDLMQESALLFSKPLWLSDAATPEGYRRQAVKEIHDRCERARRTRGTRGDLLSLAVHGQPDARFSFANDFRDDLDFGPNVQRIGDYLKEQNKALQTLQQAVRDAAASGTPRPVSTTVTRVAEDLLDRVVVQRSRALCKEIEKLQGSSLELLFRADAGPPERLSYSDEYDGIRDVLAGFLPLFDFNHSRAATTPSAVNPLSLKVYMWFDVREGIKGPDEVSSVVGLQRILVLKRLESSPISFLITLLRLAALHARRLEQLLTLCGEAGDRARASRLQGEIDALLADRQALELDKIRSLVTGDGAREPRNGFLKALSKAYSAARPAAAEEDENPEQPELPGIDDDASQDARAKLDRLWGLREDLVRDFGTLLGVTPGLADVVFGRFARAEWPRRFTAGGDDIDWPRSAAWGMRLVADAKIRALVSRLLLARRAGQKAIVFSQFSDTLAYLRSVLEATRAFADADWRGVLPAFGFPRLTAREVSALIGAASFVSGDTDGRDDVVNAFAPFYRIGPFPPSTEGADAQEKSDLLTGWEEAWKAALARPVDVLFSTDVLAEGVNLQDAAVLVNYDVHWNPVRMIQRTGRIDRRLNPRIEKGVSFPGLEALARSAGAAAPVYWWAGREREAPLTVNMILPDELEAELLLRERISMKTLAIDFTLGLEQGTGAEADWMAGYRYHGVSSLNAFQKDRAIELVAGHHERLSRAFKDLGVLPGWAENLNGWFRSGNGTPLSPLVGRALLGRSIGELERFSRYLEPGEKDGVPHWFWAEKRPGDSIFDGWLILDGRPENFPPHPRRDIPFHDNVATPVHAAHLLGAVEYLEADPGLLELPGREFGRSLQQGASALAAPKLGTDDDRKRIVIRDFFILQLPRFEASAGSARQTPVEAEPATPPGRTHA